MSYGASVKDGGYPGVSGPHSPRFQSAAPAVYQIDFTAVAAGKRIANTKRRIRWYVGGKTTEAAKIIRTSFRIEIHHRSIYYSSRCSDPFVFAVVNWLCLVLGVGDSPI
jgi:hypothetical protein